MHTCSPSISEGDVGRTDIRGYLFTHHESEAGLSYKSLVSKNQNLTIIHGAVETSPCLAQTVYQQGLKFLLTHGDPFICVGPVLPFWIPSEVISL